MGALGRRRTAVFAKKLELIEPCFPHSYLLAETRTLGIRFMSSWMRKEISEEKHSPLGCSVE
jgi:hypothetical protein